MTSLTSHDGPRTLLPRERRGRSQGGNGRNRLPGNDYSPVIIARESMAMSAILFQVSRGSVELHRTTTAQHTTLAPFRSRVRYQLLRCGVDSSYICLSMKAQCNGGLESRSYLHVRDDRAENSFGKHDAARQSTTIGLLSTVP